jgi:hypothetical protein
MDIYTYCCVLMALITAATVWKWVTGFRGFVECDQGRHYVDPRRICKDSTVDCRACAVELAAREATRAREIAAPSLSQSEVSGVVR